MIATTADPPTAASNDNVLARKRNVVTSAMPPMNCGYTPAANSIVPPEMPGTRLAKPINTPPRIPRSSCGVSIIVRL